MLQWLGVKPSYSRPRVSDDNAYTESLFGSGSANLKSAISANSGHHAGLNTDWRTGVTGGQEIGAPEKSRRPA